MNAPARRQAKQAANLVEGSDLSLSDLRNVGKATLSDLKLLGIDTVAELAGQDADQLYDRLCNLSGTRQDPCVHDVFSAAIHQARTGEALDWWAFTAARKARTPS